MPPEILYAAIWYLLIVLIGIVSLPIITSICGSLPDRGYSVSKVLGILLLAYTSWMLSYIAGYGRAEIILSLLIICIFSVYFSVKSKLVIHRRLLFRNELIFFSTFLFFLIIRAFNPEIHGGEKPNDFMVFNSILRSVSFPPHDAWLSGFRIDMYYYFGSYTIATITKLAGIPAHIAYNLGMSLLPALAANAAFGIGYNLTKSKKAGFVAMFLLVFAGNLYPAAVISSHALGITKTMWGDVPEIIDYWMASRIIPGTINEFPYFSFIFGDLHAHVIAMPFVLLTITLILDFYSAKRITAISFVFLALSIGSIFVFNAWDYPTYAFFFLLILITKSIVQFKPPGIGKITDLSKQLSAGILIFFLGFLMFLPFFMDFNSPSVQGIKAVEERTGLLGFLVIYSLFLFLILSFMLLNLPEFEHRKGILIILAASSIALYFFPNFQLLSVLVPLGFLCGVNIYSFYRNNDLSRLFISLMFALGIVLLLFTELFYFDDLMSPPYERINTVFKYYIQVWILWSIASAYAFLDLYKKKYRMKNFVMAMLLMLIVLNSLYLFTGTYAKANGFKGNMTLDGLAFMKKINYGDYDAIFWVNMNLNSTHVILEAPGSSFLDTSRISSYTGVPTVIGWVSHELVWRNNWGELSTRMRDVDTIYNTLDYSGALLLLKKYNVSYVYVGDVELKKYNAQGLRKFENTSNFGLVYRGASEIYRVI